MPRNQYRQGIMAASGPVDHFPSTHRTWLQTQLDQASVAVDMEDTGDSGNTGNTGNTRGIADTTTADVARNAIRAIGRHVMERYREPLCAYIKGSRWRTFGEPDDLVAGFFAKRLSTTDYLKRWQMTGVPLRRWLMNGILIELRSVARDDRRRSAREHGWRGSTASDATDGPTNPEQLVSHEPQAEQAFERAWARSVIVQAAAMAEEELSAEGQDLAWRLFERHVLDGIEYRAAALELGVDPERTRALSRLAAYRLRRSIGRVLDDDGVQGDGLERAIEDVYAAAMGDR